jgi:hypothetical protein
MGVVSPSAQGEYAHGFKTQAGVAAGDGEGLAAEIDTLGHFLRRGVIIEGTGGRLSTDDLGQHAGG